MSPRAATDARGDFRFDLQRSPSQPSLTHTVTTEQSDDQGRALMTPYATSLEFDASTNDDHGHLLPKGAAPARPGATSALGGSWGRSSGRSSIRKMPSMPSRPVPEFVATQTPTPAPPLPAPSHTDTEKRKSKRLSLTRSLHDLRERRAADKARKRASTASEKLPNRVPDLRPEVPPVPSIPSMYKTAGPSYQPNPQLLPDPIPPTAPRSRFSMLPSRRDANKPRSAGAPPAPPTPKSSGFAGFIRKLTTKKSKADLGQHVPHVPPVPPMPRSQRSGTQRSATRQPGATMAPRGPFGSMGRKTRLDNVPHVEAPKAVRGMLAEMKDESGSIQRRGTDRQQQRQSQIRRVPVPTYSVDDFEPIIDPRDLPAPPEPPVELADAAEARADAFARLIGSGPTAASIKSTDSGDSRRVRAPVPPLRTNSLRSKQSTPASKSGSDVPVTPPPEAMDVFTGSAAPVPIIAREVSEEPESIGDDRPPPGSSIEFKSVRRFSVTSQVVVIDKDGSGDLRPPKLNIVTGRSAPPTASAKPEHTKISRTSESETEDEYSMPVRQESRERPAVSPLIIPVPTVGGSPLTFGAGLPKHAEAQQTLPPQPFLAESPTDRDSFGHGFIPPAALSRQNSNDDFHSAYGHGSVFGSDAGHGPSSYSRHAMYGGSRSDLGHTTIRAPYGTSRSDLGHGYSAQTARMFSASASRSDLGHGSGLTHHPFIAAGHLASTQTSASRSHFSRSPMASRSDLGHGLSPMVSQTDLGYAISPAASRSDLGHGVRQVTRSEMGHGTRSESSHGFRQPNQSENGHGRPLASKRSFPDLRIAKTSFPDLRQASSMSRQVSRETSSGRSGSVASHRMPSRQASCGDLALSRGPSTASRRLGGRKVSYDDFARLAASSHGHGSVSGHGHDSEDFYSALDHSSIGHSSWLHEDPSATPRTPRTPRTFAGSSPAREAPVGDGLSLERSGSRTRLRSLTRKMSKKTKQPPTSYDAYAEKQVQLLHRRKSCKPTMHSDASLAAEINGVTDKEDARVMEAVFMA